MKKLIYLIVLALILGLVLTGCLLSNVGQVPATEQSGITYLTKNGLLTGLVGLWSFDEGEDPTIAYDSSGNNNHGTIHEAIYNPDQWGGQALSFDGVNDYVDCGDDASFDFEDKFTVEAWINLNVIPGYYDIIVNRAYGNWMFAVYAGKLMFGEYLWYCLWDRHIYSDVVSWNVGQWYHVAVVYDTIGKTADFYLDGVSIGTGRKSSDEFGIVNSGNVVISSYIGATGFNGLIDEVRIWNTALAPGTIADHATVGVYGFSGLLAPYVAPPKAFKAGRSIPLKWQYTDNFGNEVESSAAGPSVKVIFKGTTEEFPEETITVEDTGESGYRYHSGTKTWQFNWQTKSCEAGRYEIWITSMQTGQVNGPIMIDLQ